MAMTACNECGKEISTSAKSCPGCGASTGKTLGKILKITIAILIALIIFMAVGLLGATSPEGQKRIHDKEIIEQCWREQSKKSLSTDTAQSVAGACEQFEEDYQKNHGSKP